MFTRLWTLTRFAMALALGPVTFVAAPTPVLADPPADPVDLDATYQGEAPERYAQVKSVEGDVRIRKGDLEEALERGVPVAEGDVIDSRGRGVLQLGDGTRVAFASGARFQVAALFTDKRGERQVLLRLDRGRLRIALGGHSDARVRVDTQAGTASMLDRGNATLQVEGDQSVRVRVHSGHLSFSNDQDKARINAGERLTIYSRADRLDRVTGFNTYDRDSFDSYCERALEVRRGASWERVPAEIRYYSDELDENGEWVDVPEVGWCWRPRAVEADWRPYWRGRWGAYAGGMTWVSDDPWGYVTFHFGRWGWSSAWGWYWMPGRYYSPAWVAWNWTDGYYGWAPLNYWNRPCNWGYGAWGGGYCWNVVQFGHINAHRIHSHIHNDRRVIAGFHGGTGASSWESGPGRLAPWRTAPLLVSQAEFRNPAQMAHAFDRRVSADRMQTYERSAQAATGRGVVRRDAPGPREDRMPFEDRRSPGSTGAPPVRGNTGVVPPDRLRSPETRPTDGMRSRETVPPGPRDGRSRDFFGEERSPRPQERSREERTLPDRREERRSEPMRREAPAERRPERGADAPREERRSEPSRDRPRESQRESRPSSPPPSRPSAPAPSAPAPRSAPPSGGSGNGPRR